MHWHLLLQARHAFCCQPFRDWRPWIQSPPSCWSGMVCRRSRGDLPGGCRRGNPTLPQDPLGSVMRRLPEAMAGAQSLRRTAGELPETEVAGGLTKPSLPKTFGVPRGSLSCLCDCESAGQKHQSQGNWHFNLDPRRRGICRLRFHGSALRLAKRTAVFVVCERIRESKAAIGCKLILCSHYTSIAM